MPPLALYYSQFKQPRRKVQTMTNVQYEFGVVRNGLHVRYFADVQEALNCFRLSAYYKFVVRFLKLNEYGCLYLADYATFYKEDIKDIQRFEELMIKCFGN